MYLLQNFQEAKFPESKSENIKKYCINIRDPFAFNKYRICRLLLYTIRTFRGPNVNLSLMWFKREFRSIFVRFFWYFVGKSQVSNIFWWLGTIWIGAFGERIFHPHSAFYFFFEDSVIFLFTSAKYTLVESRF